MSEPLFGEPEGPCTNCLKRPAKTWWSGEGGIIGAIHGMMAAWCMTCCTEEQLRYAKEAAARIPELEEKLKNLREQEV